MKRKMFFVLVLITGFTASLFAQVQATVGVDITAIGGIKMTVEASDEPGSASKELHKIPFPYGQLAYNFDLGIVDIGLGAKIYTLIIVSAMYPLAYIDVTLGPVVLHGGIGGGMFFLFSPIPAANITKTGNVFLPELGAYIKIGKTFQFGASVIMLKSDMNEVAIPYIGCISARFVFDLF